MPTTKSVTKRATKAGPAKAGTPKRAATAKPTARDEGEAAFLRLRARLGKLAAERIVQPRAGVREAASFVLSDTLRRLRDAGLRARFAALPAAEFDHSALADLGPAAEAVLWTQTELATAEAGSAGARLSVALVTQATALRNQMLEVCAYHFREAPALHAQVEDIRSGHGYLDLAQDLQRLAALYRAQAALLKQDLRFYRAGDAAEALALATRITSELRPQGPQAARDAAWRAWTLLTDLYAEVARGAHFLLREAGQVAFPSLHAVSRSTPRRRGKTPPAPPAPVSPPAK